MAMTSQVRWSKTYRGKFPNLSKKKSALEYDIFQNI